MTIRNWISQSISLLTCFCILMSSQLDAAAVKDKRAQKKAPPTNTYDVTACPHNDGVNFDVYVGQKQTTGTVHITNTPSQIQIAVDMSSTSYLINELHIFAALNESDCDEIPLSGGKNPKFGHFPFKASYNPGTAQTIYTINIADIGCYSDSSDSCSRDIHMVISLDLTDSLTGKDDTGFAKGSSDKCWKGSRWGYCLIYKFCLDTTPPIVISGGDIAVCSGNPVIVVASVPPESGLLLQWQKDGQNIPGATTTSYAITNARPSDSGVYTLIATDECGNEGHSDSLVTVVATPNVTSLNYEPEDVDLNSIPFHSTITLSVPNPEPTWIYQWFKADQNGSFSPINGQTGSELILANFSARDSASYYVQVVAGELGVSCLDQSDVVTLNVASTLPSTKKTNSLIKNGQKLN